MKGFDSKSWRLVIFSTLCSLAFLAVPTLQALREKQEPSTATVIWSTRTRTELPMEIRCDPLTDTVVLFDGSRYRQHSYATGMLRASTTIPNNLPFTIRPGALLSPDGKNIISFSRTRFRREPSMGRLLAMFEEVLVRQAPSLKPVRKFSIYDVNIPRLMGANGRLDSVSKNHVGIWETYNIWTPQGSDKPNRSFRNYVLYDLKTGQRAPWPEHPGIDQSQAIKALTPNGELLRGGLQDNANSNLGKVLFLEDIRGNRHQLQFDARDQPATNGTNWQGATLVFNPEQTRVWGSIQAWDRIGRLGSVVCWDWKSGRPLWRWEELEAKPSRIALSPNRKQLAMAVSITLENNPMKEARLLILDSNTGKILHTLERDRSPKTMWGRIMNRGRKVPDTLLNRGGVAPVIDSLCWAPDGKSLFVVYADSEVIRWGLRSTT